MGSSSLRVPPPPQATKRGFATRDAQLLLFVDFVVLFDPRTGPSFLPRGWPVFDEQNICSLTTVAHPPDADETRTECVVLMSSSLRVPPPPQATKRGFATRDAQLLLFVDFVVLFD